MRVGAVDCGTNSIRLLIADVVDDGRLRDVHREMRIVRLGQGVDATGEFAPEAIARTRVALTAYADLMRAYDVSRVRMVATSAPPKPRRRPLRRAPRLHPSSPSNASASTAASSTSATAS